MVTQGQEVIINFSMDSYKENPVLTREFNQANRALGRVEEGKIVLREDLTEEEMECLKNGRLAPSFTSEQGSNGEMILRLLEISVIPEQVEQ